jgi:hypothetical protein
MMSFLGPGILLLGAGAFGFAGTLFRNVAEGGERA